MKTTSKLFVAILVLLATWACKKEDKATYGTSIAPMQDIISTLPASVSYFRDEPVIVGYAFKPTKDGRITHLGLRAGRGTYNVYLWDSLEQRIIETNAIQVTDSLIFNYKDITDINITANKTYYLSMYNQIAEGGSGAHAYINSFGGYPFTRSNIIINSFFYKISSNPTQFFELDGFYTNSISGIVDFKFEPKL
jgi:hypothetical protein